MPVSPRDIREHLLAHNPEFQRLAQEHSSYEAQLEQLSKAHCLSTEDLIREITLKKMKLRVKDEMEQLVARHARLSAQHS